MSKWYKHKDKGGIYKLYNLDKYRNIELYGARIELYYEYDNSTNDSYSDYYSYNSDDYSYNCDILTYDSSAKAKKAFSKICKILIKNEKH